MIEVPLEVRGDPGVLCCIGRVTLAGKTPLYPQVTKFLPGRINKAMINPQAEDIQGWNALIIHTLPRLNRLDRDP
ncbi:hypothetical protein N9D23_09195 [Rubripirellula sp.]|jgi:hypothetical protein|nr:hypothetical protein [Planctomycetaceae bacterium]MDA9858283.1 hypothetical protein [Rubripirellula sp.]MDF1842195.1 hypothetical protein [Rubripirellula sp.]